MDENFQKLYSPSQWSKRLAPDEIIDAHLEYMKKSLLFTLFKKS
jgi:hypothetical protein